MKDLKLHPNLFLVLRKSNFLLLSAVKNLVGGRTYHFRVLANSVSSYEASDEVKFPVPARVKHKAITAGVVGGILFFIVAIILSVCAVKICNKRKRRKQEKGNAATNLLYGSSLFVMLVLKDYLFFCFSI